MKQFTHESMYVIRNYLQQQLQNSSALEIRFEVLNPDCKEGLYAGEEVVYNNKVYRYRGYKAWVDLAQSLMCKLSTPIVNLAHTVILTFKRLNTNSTFHTHKKEIQERYGSDSIFARINKNEEPAFLDAFIKAFDFIHLQHQNHQTIRILNLGINRGLEFELLQQHLQGLNIEFVGIDYCNSAINEAKERFKNQENFHFIAHDINQLDQLQLGKFDCIMCIGTLQSSTLEFKPLFMNLVQHYLVKQGCMILGFANTRWFDGEMIYGATLPNYTSSELTRLFKDVYFCKKYLQQKQFKVMLQGKNYIFLAAKPIKIKSSFDKIIAY
jgi:2-polyprenyl-3-methyl-5-hydroxy-6-metoxy-1,4-benzoquinol methylase